MTNVIPFFLTLRQRIFLSMGPSTVKANAIVANVTSILLVGNNLLNKANLVPSAFFRYKRKAKKRPWNTSNT